MGKQNGWDGLWGLEMNFNNFKPVNAVVFEFLQTTNMSGPLHGLHEPEEGPVHKTGGSDNYYNNGLYPGWAHWGMMIANPLIASPIYNQDGDMTFKYNRIKALHIGWSGQITSEWSYIAKMSHNRTWGTRCSHIGYSGELFGLCLVLLFSRKMERLELQRLSRFGHGRYIRRQLRISNENT